MMRLTTRKVLNRDILGGMIKWGNMANLKKMKLICSAN